jgi:hypothetical protein
MESMDDPFEAMRRFPHRVKNPMLRAIVTAKLEDSDADPRSIRPENERSDWIIAEPRRISDGKPDA